MCIRDSCGEGTACELAEPCFSACTEWTDEFAEGCGACAGHEACADCFPGAVAPTGGNCTEDDAAAAAAVVSSGLTVSGCAELTDYCNMGIDALCPCSCS